MTSRRSFLIGIGAALAAPAIVRAESLMKLWVPPKSELIPYLPPSEDLMTILHNWAVNRGNLLIEGKIAYRGTFADALAVNSVRALAQEIAYAR